MRIQYGGSGALQTKKNCRKWVIGLRFPAFKKANPRDTTWKPGVNEEKYKKCWVMIQQLFWGRSQKKPSPTQQWTQWKKRIDGFMSVSGCRIIPTKRKLIYLFTWWGMWQSRLFATEHKGDGIFAEIQKKHSIPQRNIIFQWYQFNSPMPGED